MKTQSRKTTMVLCGMVACGILAGIQSARADALESFDYANGALAGQNGGTGWADAWWHDANYNATVNTYDKKMDFYTAGTSAQTSDIYRNLADPFSSGTVYMSMRAQNQNGGLRYFGVKPFSSSGMLFGSGSTIINWSIDKVMTNGVKTVVESSVSTLTESLLVLKVDFDASAGGVNEMVTFWVNPNESIPVWQLDVADSVGGQSYESSENYGSLTRLRVVTGGNSTSYIPGFTNFTMDDISIIPEPATFGLFALLGVGMLWTRRFRN